MEDRRKKMIELRELKKEDFKIIREALDLLVGCRLGRLEKAVQQFAMEAFLRTRDKDPAKAQCLYTKIEEQGQVFTDELSKLVHGCPCTSYGVKSLDDPLRLLSIQMDLRICNFSEDLKQCPHYPNKCEAPLLAFCPKK
jgi:hypothetical protein